MSRTCELCGSPALITVVGLPNRHYCLPCARQQSEWLAVHGEETVILAPPVSVKKGGPIRGKR